MALTEAEAGRVFGDSLEWAKYLPRAWRICGDAVPDAYFPSHLSLDDHLRWGSKGPAVFTAYLHLMRYRLGWNRPGRGFLTWTESGMHDREPVLDFMGLLKGDGLSWLIGWLLGNESKRDPSQPCSDFGPYPRLSDVGDSLHLAGHSWGPSHFDARDTFTEPRMQLLEPRSSWRGSTLLSETYSGWWDQLMRPSSPMKAAVDVVVKPIGWMGTYRISPVTGRAHATTEDVHVMGCA